MKQAQQPQKNVSAFSLGSASEKRSAGRTTAPFADDRAETAVQRRLQETARQSPQVQQLKAIQEKASNGQARAGEHQSMRNGGPGLPTGLRHGIEQLSGYSMGDVAVHYNSAKPAQVHAHAFAQNRQIHLAPGQEKHLPHEAWHIAQQKQGRVKPTMQMKGHVNINHDAGLEHEADVMGAKANELGSNPQQTTNFRPLMCGASSGESDAPMQCEFTAKYFKPDSQNTMKDAWDEYQTQDDLHLAWTKANRINPQKAGPKVAAASIPWVEFDDLYVALIPTGPGSWQPIVEKRFAAGSKEFTIFSGTHGNVAGQFLDKDGNYDKRYKAEHHTVDDKSAVANLKAAKAKNQDPIFPGLDIEVLDIFEDEHKGKKLNHPTNLQKSVHDKISSGRVVILAWCFSLEGFTAREGVEGTEEEERDLIGKRNNVPIADIIAEQYGDLANYKKPAPAI